MTFNSDFVPDVRQPHTHWSFLPHSLPRCYLGPAASSISCCGSTYLQMYPTLVSLCTSSDRQLQGWIPPPGWCWERPPAEKNNTRQLPLLVLARRVASEIQIPWEPSVPGIQAFFSQQSLGQKANWLLETLLRYLYGKQRRVVCVSSHMHISRSWWLNR